ncbi:MAG: hypothetical protein ACYDEN_07715 [Acidimicrobiales bacterium]
MAEAVELPLPLLIERLRSAQFIGSDARDEQFPQPEALLDSFAVTLDYHLRQEAARPARERADAGREGNNDAINGVQGARYLLASLASRIALPGAPDGGGNGAMERLFLPYGPRILERTSNATVGGEGRFSTDSETLLKGEGLSGLGMDTSEQRRQVASTCAGVLESLFPRSRGVPLDPIPRAVGYILSQAQHAALALDGDPADGSGVFSDFPLTRKAGEHVGHMTYGIVVLELRLATVELKRRHGDHKAWPASFAHPAWTAFTPLVYRGAVGDEIVSRVLRDQAQVVRCSNC